MWYLLQRARGIDKLWEEYDAENRKWNDHRGSGSEDLASLVRVIKTANDASEDVWYRIVNENDEIVFSLITPQRQTFDLCYEYADVWLDQIRALYNLSAEQWKCAFYKWLALVEFGKKKSTDSSISDDSFVGRIDNCDQCDGAHDHYRPNE